MWREVNEQSRSEVKPGIIYYFMGVNVKSGQREASSKPGVANTGRNKSTSKESKEKSKAKALPLLLL